MTPELIAHIRDLTLPPVLDMRGEWVHCRNARTASTSMVHGPLRRSSVVKANDIAKWERVWDEITVPRIAQAVLFTFVRHTWERICSAFFRCRDCAKSPENQIDHRWRFADWVKQVLAVEWPAVNKHFAPQYDTMFYNGDPIPGMFVGRFERVERDWRRLSQRLGVSRRLPHWRAVSKGSYIDHYDDESRDIVGELYAREIEAFGYRYEKRA